MGETFLVKPTLPGRWTINHKDGNKLNNHVTNVEWILAKDNCLHAVEIGLHDLKGSKHPLSKITENDVIQIRKLASTNTHKEIAALYGLGRRNVGDIINHVTWKHVA